MRLKVNCNFKVYHKMRQRCRKIADLMTGGQLNRATGSTHQPFNRSWRKPAPQLLPRIAQLQTPAQLQAPQHRITQVSKTFFPHDSPPYQTRGSPQAPVCPLCHVHKTSYCNLHSSLSCQKTQISLAHALLPGLLTATNDLNIAQFQPCSTAQFMVALSLYCAATHPCPFPYGTHKTASQGTRLTRGRCMLPHVQNQGLQPTKTSQLCVCFNAQNCGLQQRTCSPGLCAQACLMSSRQPPHTSTPPDKRHRLRTAPLLKTGPLALPAQPVQTLT